MTRDTAIPTQPTTRLYISPLDAASLSRVLTPEKQSHIRSASYHCTQTLPDRPFAYLELPADLARALRQKLHGSFLRGAKMRVEEARPEKRKRRSAADDEADEAKAADKEERRSKRKRGGKPEEGVLKAMELPDGRKVKRGWVDADGKKDGSSKRGKKDSEDASLVFRTSLPPNVAANGTSGAPAKSKSKSKKAKRGDKAVTEVKEGENAAKFPTFLRHDAKDDGTRATEFVEGKGWVDESGNVVESAVKKSRARKTAPEPGPTDPGLDPDADTPSEPSSPEPSSDEDSDSGSAEDDAASAPSAVVDTPSVTVTPAPEAAPTTGSRSRSGSALPIVSTEAGADKPAPSALEALFKRPADPPSRSTRAKPAPVQTFSFFASAGASSSGSAPATNAPTADDPPSDAESASTSATERAKRRPKNLTIPPSTPFTRRDLDARALRSAAPTPDTAAIGRRFRPWGREGSAGSSGRGSVEPRAGSVGPVPAPAGAAVALAVRSAAGEGDGHDEAEEEAEAEVEAEAAKKEGSAAPAEQNEFEKHFYEQRGEYNRAWKARKREAKKGTRQAENRRGPRAKG